MYQLHRQLQADTYPLAETEDYWLRLHKNALVGWLILIPKMDCLELFDCEIAFRQRIHLAVDGLANQAQTYFQADKMNIASIGNIVPQLHIHIIARKKNDFAWPQPIWGRAEFTNYSSANLDDIRAEFIGNIALLN